MGRFPLRRFIYTRRQSGIAALLFVAYFVTYGLELLLIPANSALYPASAIAVAGLFFGGVELWPVVLAASIAAGFTFHVQEVHLFTLALSAVLQSVLGAWMLRKANVDPLFRKYSDMFNLMATAALTSLIFPTLDTLVRLLTGAPYQSLFWGRHYAGAVFSFLIIVPLILRWFAKSRFSRSLPEALETIAIFTLLIGMNVATFVFSIADVFGIYLIYLLLFPLFWIALRMRPRFVTLALFITACFAVWSVVMNSTAATFGIQLFSIETFLITVSTIFLIIVSLEEDRRLHTNIMRSQVSTLENAVARIGAESQAKNDFIAVLAHELRNPLAPVVSAIDYLKISAPRGKDEMETLDMMDSRMKIVKRLLDDLLDVSRISEGKLSIKKERVELDMVLKRAMLSTEHHVKERHQVLAYKKANRALYIMGDPVRLEQIFSNLLTNASKYSDPGDTIYITFKKSVDMAEITIRDTGVGIPEESLQHIFTPFHQVGSGARTQKGLGIGLALVRSFVRVHGGTISVMSAGNGKGSTFTVCLPLAQDNTHLAKSN